MFFLIIKIVKPLNFRIAFFTYLKVCLVTASHNFMGKNYVQLYNLNQTICQSNNNIVLLFLHSIVSYIRHQLSQVETTGTVQSILIFSSEHGHLHGKRLQCKLLYIYTGQKIAGHYIRWCNVCNQNIQDPGIQHPTILTL